MTMTTQNVMHARSHAHTHKSVIPPSPIFLIFGIAVSESRSCFASHFWHHTSHIITTRQRFKSTMIMASSTRAWRAAAALSRRGLSPRTTSIVRRHVVTATQVSIASHSTNQKQKDYKSLAALALLGTVILSEKNKADCCGIAGVVGAPSHDARYVLYSVCIVLLIEK